MAVFVDLRVALGVVLAAAVLGGCADGPSASDPALYDDVELGEAGSADSAVSTPLRNRATWKRRLDACRTSFDRAVSASAEGHAYVDDLDLYGECLRDASDRAIARIGRNIAGNGIEGFGVRDISSSFQAYRSGAFDYCYRVSGVALADEAGVSAPIHALYEDARCKLDAEIQLVESIGSVIAWADVSGDSTAFDVGFLRDGATETGVAAAPSCDEAYAAEMDAATSTLDFVEAGEGFLECMRVAVGDAAKRSYEGATLLDYEQQDFDAFAETIAGAFAGAIDEGGSVCGVLARAGESGGGSLHAIEASVCTTKLASKLAYWLDDHSPLAGE